MAIICHLKKHEFVYGKLESVAPGIRRLTARNPSVFTFHGTGTYVIGQGQVAVIDPGPLDSDHIQALIEGLSAETVTHILVTHCHLDHSPAARELKSHTGALTYGFGPHGQMTKGESESVEEGADLDFVPDVRCAHGDVINGLGWRVECVHTPGHTSNHLCFALDNPSALFTGDHIMAWSTTVVIPPDGNMTDYITSLKKLTRRTESTYWPTHGPPLREPLPYVHSLIRHRQERIQQIIQQLTRTPQTVPELVAALYQGLDTRLTGAAGRSTLASLIHLHDLGQVSCDSQPDLNSQFTLTHP